MAPFKPVPDVDPETGEVLPEQEGASAALPERYTSGTATQLAEIMEANMGGKLSIVDLPKVTIPAGGSQFWTLPSPRGEEAGKTISGVIVGTQTNRAYWPDAMGEGESALPLCSSTDGVFGSNPDVSPSCLCSTCPQARWGSAEAFKGRKTNAQACRQFEVVLLLQPGKMLPLVVRLAPTSAKALRQYMASISADGVSSWSAVTEIGLTKITQDGVDYSQATFRLVRQLLGGEGQATRAFAQLVRGKVDTAALMSSTIADDMAAIA
jgi:hypothetical protein